MSVDHAVVADRRARLLEAGKEVFAERRYEDATASEISAVAGVAHGLLFHYYGSKRKFYFAVLDSAMAEASALFDQNTETKPDEWVLRETELLLTSAAGAGQIVAALVRGSIGAESEALEIVSRFRRDLALRVLEVLSPVESSDLLDSIVDAWAAAAHELAARWVDEGRAVPEAHVQRVMVSMLQGALASIAGRKDAPRLSRPLSLAASGEGGGREAR